MTSPEKEIFACLMFGTFITCILYVVFGQVTVRKLRKNPKTKGALGTEFVSGWDIINVAQTLAIPRSWSKKFENSPLAYMYTNSDLLFEHVNKFDRILGAVFYWVLTVSGLVGILLVILNSLGVFES